jgi:tRNA G18 (ribose-2'-O)-methylase SpoU
MPLIRHIETLDHPELSPYRTLRRPAEHLRDGIFVAEGEKVVRRLLATELTVRSILVTPDWEARLLSEDLLAGRDATALLVGGKELLETIVGFHLHQGIMAVANLPPDSALEAMLHAAPPPKLFVALDSLVNAENVGVVVRSCAAFGVHGIIVGESSSSPYLRRAVRNSMGAVFALPVHHASDLAHELRLLRTGHNCSIIAADPAGARPVGETDFSSDTVIVVGNEGDGISQKVLAEATARVAIPMKGGIDSLNVANACAVFLYEARRQRGSI